MYRLDLTFPTPAENLACDEVLLDWSEESNGDSLLRFWEPSEPSVVLGYTNKIGTEVDAAACEKAGIPLLRRCTGGGAVLHDKGSLCYALILDIRDDELLKNITTTNCSIMKRLQAALKPLVGQEPRIDGYTDLTLDGRKFSGNAQRSKKNYLLFHGTFLLNVEIGRMERLLPYPTIDPEYRVGRSHSDFLVNLNVSADSVKEAIGGAWAAEAPPAVIPMASIHELARTKYSEHEWTWRFK